MGTAYVEALMSREAAAFAADDLVRGSVLALMSARRWHIMELADRAGMNDETLRRKLRAVGDQRAFTAGEVARLALCLGVPVADLYSGLDGRVRPLAHLVDPDTHGYFDERSLLVSVAA